MVFRAQLPLMDKIRYARYRIRLWPVPVNGSGHTLQVQTPKDVTVDTQRGGIFEPHNCAGNELAICRSGPIYDRGCLVCTRSILNGDVTQRGASCLFTAARETSPEGYAEKWRLSCMLLVPTERDIPYIVVENRKYDKIWK